MILSTDVFYSGETAVAAGILHRDWTTDAVERVIVKHIDTVAPYEPGAFYKRELPCLLRVLEDVDQTLEAVVVDGYVTLGPEQSPGLGRHLYDGIGQTTPVIGVAKSEYPGTPDGCRIFRGQSRQPLFVTAIGFSQVRAKASIAGMHGRHRIPTLLKMADRVCRDQAISGLGHPIPRGDTGR